MVLNAAEEGQPLLTGFSGGRKRRLASEGTPEPQPEPKRQCASGTQSGHSGTDETATLTAADICMIRRIIAEVRQCTSETQSGHSGTDETAPLTDADIPMICRIVAKVLNTIKQNGNLSEGNNDEAEDPPNQEENLSSEDEDEGIDSVYTCHTVTIVILHIVW